MRILIVEDDPACRRLMERCLGPLGQCDIAVDGLDGVNAFRKATEENRPYDLITLDIMMPELNGHQALTAKQQNSDIVEAFAAGADDYIVKPFNKSTLQARLTVGTRVIEYDQAVTHHTGELLRHSEEMEELAEARSRQLVHAERMATVGLLSAGIAHEINNPTTFIAGNVQTLRKFWADLSPALEQGDLTAIEAHKLSFIMEEMSKTIDGIHNGALRISKIVNGLKAFCHKDERAMMPCDIRACIEESLELCRNTLKYHVTVEQTFDESLPQILADAQQLEQILVNLFTNAAHAIGEREGTLSICVKTIEEGIVLEIGDTGTGIPQDKLDDIWQPFFTTKAVGEGTGLGLPTVLGIIESHKGTISVENKPEGGALFTINLPCVEKESHRESQTAHCG